MNTVAEIVAAARQLKPAQFLALRERLDRLEHRIWEAELKYTTEQFRKAGITDQDIDRAVTRRRRENRR